LLALEKQKHIRLGAAEKKRREVKECNNTWYADCEGVNRVEGGV